jgi:hypothetical protein
MIFSIDIDVITTTDQQQHEQIDDLMRLVRIGKHQAIFPDDEEAIYQSDWLGGLGQRAGHFFVELYEKSVSKNFYSKPTANIFIVPNNKDKADDKFSLKDGLYYLEQPAIILLENVLYDRPFINAILRTFKAEAILEAKNAGWLQYQGAGGKNMIINTIEAALKENPRHNPTKFLRTLVIIDSDKKSLDEIPGKTQQGIADFCTKNNIPYHILYKREMENYLPDVLLQQLPPELQDAVQTFCNLSEEQRDFYDLEKGFKDKNKSKANIPSIFENLTEVQHNLLRKGFHRTGKSEKVKYIAKQQLPLLFDSLTLTKKDLTDRIKHQEETDSQEKANNQELSTIIDKIKQLL